MKHKLMTAVAAVALMAGAGLASAQGTKEAPAPGAAEQKGSATEQRGKAAQPQQNTPRPNQGAQREGQSMPSTQGQGERDKPAQGAQREQDKPAQGAQREQDKSKPTTQGQGQAEREKSPQGAQRDQRPGTPGTAQERTGQDRDRPGTAQDKSGSTGASVTLNTEQKTKIRQTIIQKSDAPRVTNVNFSLSVGTMVPRQGVRLVAVPPTLVEIHPAWRGYMYFIVGDQLIIVEPSSHRIVAVIAV